MLLHNLNADHHKVAERAPRAEQLTRPVVRINGEVRRIPFQQRTVT